MIIYQVAAINPINKNYRKYKLFLSHQKAPSA